MTGTGNQREGQTAERGKQATVLLIAVGLLFGLLFGLLGPPACAERIAGAPGAAPPVAPESDEAEQSESAPLARTREVSLAPLGPATDPCIDFATYACGPSRRRLVRDNDVLVWRGAALLRFLEELIAGGHQDGSAATALVRDFHRRCLDGAARQAGYKELQAQLVQIAAAKTLPDLARLLGGQLRAFAVPLLIAVEDRFDNSAADNPVYARVRLRGPHLPRALDRNRNHSDRLRDEQRIHWQRLAILSGVIAPEEVDAAMRINAWLAAAGRPDFKKGDTIPLVHRNGFAGARFPWHAFFDGLDLPDQAPLRPADPHELDRIDRLVELPLEDLKSFARVLLMEGASEYLDVSAVEEEARFHDGVVPNARYWHRSLAKVCLRLTARDLESPLADAYLSDLADANAEALVRPLFDALRGHLARDIYLVNWIDPASRDLAIRQVNAVRLRLIGDVEATPPDVSLAGPQSFFDAHRRVRGAVMAKRLAQLGTSPLGRDVSPNFSVGRYSSLSNLVWLSPEIVRPPYVWGRDYNAITFGSLGTVIGHELSHAFARAPRAATGATSHKWSDAAAEALRSRAQCFARKFDSFIRAADDETARRSSAEDDLADIVGVQLALQALDTQAAAPRSRFGDHYRRDFFLTFAHTVCAFSGDDAAEMDDLRDPHAPGRARINGVVSNLPAFAEAFACVPDTPMAPRERCPVW